MRDSHAIVARRQFDLRAARLAPALTEIGCDRWH
jgi:hypothetical protein